MEAKEERDVATVDIPGAFLQEVMDEVVHIILRGNLVNLLLLVNREKYIQYVVREQGSRVLYLKLKKTLYGTVCASLLFWRNLTGNYKKRGLSLTPTTIT